MRVQRSGGNVPDWVGALDASKPKAEEPLKENPSTEEELNAGLDVTLSNMFGTTIKHSPEEAVRHASKEILESVHEQEIKQAEESLRSDRFKPLVAPVDRSWEKNQGQAKSSVEFNAETTRSGKITSAGEIQQNEAQKTPLPQNSNSIFDPFRLDALAAEGTAHDRMIEERRAEKAKRHAEIFEADRKAREESLPPPEVKHLQGGKVHSLAGIGNSEFRHKVPANKVSMLDDIGPKDATPEQLKESLQNLFTQKVPDTRTQIREANEKRKEEIQRPSPEKDKSWEKVEKPLSTAELTRRLTDKWLPPEPETPEESGK